MNQTGQLRDRAPDTRRPVKLTRAQLAMCAGGWIAVAALAAIGKALGL